MKKINNLIAILLVGLMGVVGMGTVYADEPSTGGTGTPSTGGSTNQQAIAVGGITIDCENYKIAVGASTTCTVYLDPDTATNNSSKYTTKNFEALAAITGKKTAIITMSQSKYITINKIVANTANGYSLDSDGNINDRTLENHKIQLSHTGTLDKTKKTAMMSFRLTVENEAKNLSQGECGQVCIEGAEFDANTVKATLKAGDTGKACPNVIITEQKCTGDNCNPDTGAFMNYAMVAGAAGVALVAIAVVTRKKKFYTV